MSGSRKFKDREKPPLRKLDFRQEEDKTLGKILFNSLSNNNGSDELSDELVTRFEGVDCSYAYDDKHGIGVPTVFTAIEKGGYKLVPFLINHGANPFEEFKERMPLNEFINQQNPYVDDCIDNNFQEKLSDIIKEIRKTPDKQLILESALREASILGNDTIVNFLKEAYKDNFGLNSIPWSEKPTMDDLRNLYENLKAYILKHYEISKQLTPQKKLLIIVGEAHDSYNSAVIQAIIINIAKNLGIKDFCIEEAPDLKSNVPSFIQKNNRIKGVHKTIAAAHSFNMESIDVGRQFNQTDYEPTGIELRDKAMAGKLVKKNVSSLASIGSSHIKGISEDKTITNIYQVCAINTCEEYPKEAYKDHPGKLVYQNYYTSSKCFQAILPGKIQNSSETAVFLAEIAAAQNAESTQAVFKKHGLAKESPLKNSLKSTSSLINKLPDEKNDFNRDELFLKLLGILENENYWQSKSHDSNKIPDGIKQCINLYRDSDLLPDKLLVEISKIAQKCTAKKHGFFKKPGDVITDSYYKILTELSKGREADSKIINIAYQKIKADLQEFMARKYKDRVKKTF